ncbi:hypothetical protein [Streptomyces marianii]|uniref:Uncharacterized protein n=1 Tax=Streptomyces marianii TaxID=1817406 RepID=A0A5R9DTY6_9ACTN|nr:hypothetical protein [Streptomyces marianii]TLQ39208.1 hypothetical protein FEF34_38055 [Streptomyces marianii]
MNTEPLNAFPSFRLRPAEAGAHDLLAPDGRVAGQVLASSGGHLARVGPDSGPLRRSPQGAGADAVMFHIAGHGLPDEPAAAYSGSPEARVAVGLVPLQRQELTDVTARAFTFYALRQPHVAAIFAGLDVVGSERDAVHSRTGCRRIARLLLQVQEPAQALLGESGGDARDWLAFPLARLLTFCHQARARLVATAERPPADLCGRYTSRRGADADMDTLHRIWRNLRSAAPTTGLTEIEAAMAALPGDRYAGSAKECRATAARLVAVRTAAEKLTAASCRTAEPERAVLAGELSALAAEAGVRLEATALVLDDTGRLGTVRTINDTLALARLGASAGGEQSVRVGGTELGPVRRTADGMWSGPGIGEPYNSFEGATVALIRAHLAKVAAERRARLGLT